MLADTLLGGRQQGQFFAVVRYGHYPFPRLTNPPHRLLCSACLLGSLSVCVCCFAFSWYLARVWIWIGPFPVRDTENAVHASW